MFQNGFTNQTTRRIVQRPRVSDKNVMLRIALGLLYFFMMPVAILVFVGMYYFGKIRVFFKGRQYLMSALGIMAICALIPLPHAYMTLRITTFILFILYFCRRFAFSMK